MAEVEQKIVAKKKKIILFCFLIHICTCIDKVIYNAFYTSDIYLYFIYIFDQLLY